MTQAGTTTLCLGRRCAYNLGSSRQSVPVVIQSTEKSVSGEKKIPCLKPELSSHVEVTHY